MSLVLVARLQECGQLLRWDPVGFRPDPELLLAGLAPVGDGALSDGPTVDVTLRALL